MVLPHPSLLFIAVIFFSHMTPTVADFSVFARISSVYSPEEDSEPDTMDDLILCGQNDYNCGCYDGHSAKVIDYEGLEMAESGYNLFSYDLCGGQPGAIELTKQADGHWDVKTQWMPGVVVGTCVEERGLSDGCPGLYSSVAVNSRLHCTSWLCA
jgi:hypothetical protein